MPRNFSELKSGGGGNSYAAPHPEKWGDASPRPPPIDARASMVMFDTSGSTVLHLLFHFFLFQWRCVNSK